MHQPYLFLSTSIFHGYNTGEMRIILSKEEITDKKAVVLGDKAKYLISVLRCKKGDEFEILDGEGNIYKSRISGIEGKKIIAEIYEEQRWNTESPLNLTLVQGMLKGEKMDLVIQKTTELGIKKIIPAVTERGQISYTRKLSRWRKIAEEASKQSGRTGIPEINEPMEFKNIFSSNPPSPPFSKGGMGGLYGFIFWEEGGMSLKEAILRLSSSPVHPFDSSPIHILIGPEGGFTRKEVELANSSGLITVSLGNRILRAETAAIATTAIVQFVMGDMNKS